MSRILCIGLGGVGTIAAYALQTFNSDVEVVAVVRSDYEVILKSGFTISSVDYGTRKGKESEENQRKTFTYRPSVVVNSIEEATLYGPYDYIVVSTKVTQNHPINIWDEVSSKGHSLLLPEKKTSIVLMQNGINPEIYWKDLKQQVHLISGVSYISSTRTNTLVTQYGRDLVKFGLFDETEDKHHLKIFHQLYSNEYNHASVDHNVALTRWRKLLWNASFNTVCCLTNSDVGGLFKLNDNYSFIDNVIRELMKEVQFVANTDLELNHKTQEGRILDEEIPQLLGFTEKSNAMDSYVPSMLVDYRNGRPIEFEVILANIIDIHKKNLPEHDLKISIPYLNFLFYLLAAVQQKLTSNN